MIPQIKSQLLGVSLAISTAIGCIAYERLVKSFSLRVILIVCFLFYIPLFLTLFFINPKESISEIGNAFTLKEYKWPIFLYWITWITTPIWFWITKKQGVMVGSIYEVKYIIILGLFYVFLGKQLMTWNVIIGIFLALCSIYFISK